MATTSPQAAENEGRRSIFHTRWGDKQLDVRQIVEATPQRLVYLDSKGARREAWRVRPL